MDLEQRVKELLASVLQVPAEDITDASSMDTVPSWDSLAVLVIALAVEDEFGIQLAPAEQVEITGYKKILELVLCKA